MSSLKGHQKRSEGYQDRQLIGNRSGKASQSNPIRRFLLTFFLGVDSRDSLSQTLMSFLGRHRQVEQPEGKVA